MQKLQHHLMCKKKQDYSLLLQILQSFSINPKGESCSNKLLQHSQEQNGWMQDEQERERWGENPVA
jgi:hypothetical protein